MMLKTRHGVNIILFGCEICMDVIFEEHYLRQAKMGHSSFPEGSECPEFSTPVPNRSRTKL
jgi:hypothetical protein